MVLKSLLLHQVSAYFDVQKSCKRQVYFNL